MPHIERWANTTKLLRKHWKKDHPDKVIIKITVDKQKIKNLENHHGKVGRGDLKPYTVTYRKRKK